jgi:hypothetical protein
MTSAAQKVRSAAPVTIPALEIHQHFSLFLSLFPGW